MVVVCSAWNWARAPHVTANVDHLLLYLRHPHGDGSWMRLCEMLSERETYSLMISTSCINTWAFFPKSDLQMGNGTVVCSACNWARAPHMSLQTWTVLSFILRHAQGEVSWMRVCEMLSEMGDGLGMMSHWRILFSQLYRKTQYTNYVPVTHHLLTGKWKRKR